MSYLFKNHIWLGYRKNYLSQKNSIREKQCLTKQKFILDLQCVITQKTILITKSKKWIKIVKTMDREKNDDVLFNIIFLPNESFFLYSASSGANKNYSPTNSWLFSEQEVTTSFSQQMVNELLFWIISRKTKKKPKLVWSYNYSWDYVFFPSIMLFPHYHDDHSMTFRKSAPIFI